MGIVQAMFYLKMNCKPSDYSILDDFDYIKQYLLS